MFPVSDVKKYWKDTIEWIDECLKVCFDPVQRERLLDRREWYELCLKSYGLTGSRA